MSFWKKPSTTSSLGKDLAIGFADYLIHYETAPGSSEGSNIRLTNIEGNRVTYRIGEYYFSVSFNNRERYKLQVRKEDGLIFKERGDIFDYSRGRVRPQLGFISTRREEESELEEISQEKSSGTEPLWDKFLEMNYLKLADSIIKD